MRTKLLFCNAPSILDKAILCLAERLFVILKRRIVCVEKFVGKNGENVRIVVKDLNSAINDKILEIIKDIKKEFAESVLIIPEIISEKEYSFLTQGKEVISISDDMLNELRECFINKLDDIVVHIEKIVGINGENVRIIVKRLNSEIVDKILEIIEDIEKRFKSGVLIIPEIISVDNY